MPGTPPPFGSFSPGSATRALLWLSQNTSLGRGKARKVMGACVRVLNKTDIDVVLFGQNIRVHTHHNGPEMKALLNPRKYCRDEFAFCGKYLQAQNPVFVDIGANAGFFSLGMIGKMSGGVLIAAEPQPILHERLTNNLSIYNLPADNRPIVHAYKVAIGGEAGDLMLSVPDQLGQASAHILEGASQIKVPMRSLIDILAQAHVTHIDVLKLDVEGYEDAVLEPFFESAPVALWPKAIVLEHCHKDRWGYDCEAMLLKAGYKLEHKDRTNLMLARVEK